MTNRFAVGCPSISAKLPSNQTLTGGTLKFSPWRVTKSDNCPLRGHKECNRGSGITGITVKLLVVITEPPVVVISILTSDCAGVGTLVLMVVAVGCPSMSAAL